MVAQPVHSEPTRRPTTAAPPRWLESSSGGDSTIGVRDAEVAGREQGRDRLALLTNAIYLNNTGCEIEGLKIWGSPVSPISPKFGDDWAFNIERGPEIRRYWEQIPANVDILITHCPPFGILDKNGMGDNEGCKDLADLIENKIRPRIHIFGHIHEAYGQVQIGTTNYINASAVCLKSWIADYKITRKLRIVAVSIFQIIKQLRKKLFGVPKDKLHNTTLSNWHWKVNNKAIVVDA